MLVIIPAYQPDEKLKKVVLDLRAETDYPLLIVDDGSSESCMPLFAELEAYATVLHHDGNKGKGRAMKTAFAWAKEHCAPDEGVVAVDADGQHLTKDVLRVCECYEQNKDALVLGSRRFTGKVPFKSRAGNAITRGVFHASTGVKVYDTQTGLRAFSVQRIPLMLELKGERYEYEINQLLQCTRDHIPIVEVPIETVYIQDNESSHFHALRDSWRIYKVILGFISSSLLSFALDYILFLLLSMATHGLTIPFIAAKLDWSRIVSTAGARVVSLVFNYSLNRKVVFQAANRSSFPRFVLLAVAIYFAQLGLLTLLTDVVGIHEWLSYIVAQLILYPLNFLLQRKFVFVKGKGN